MKKISPVPVIDEVLETYTRYHQHPLNILIHRISIPVILFALLGLVWCIPFPHVSFLGRYNGFVNWASFLIAFSVYYYYRLSPVLSYVILLLVFIFSAGIVSLEKLEADKGWPSVWVVCAALLVAGGAGQFAGHTKEPLKVTLLKELSFLATGPVWLFSFLFKK